MIRSRFALAALALAASVLAGCAREPEAETTAAPAGTAAAETTAGEPSAIEPLSALAPSNIARERPPAPFDLTGNWFIDTSVSAEAWRFGPPYPKLTPAAQMHADASQKYLK